MQLSDLDDESKALWRIKDGELPYKKIFPEMIELDGGPNNFWKMKDGELPYKNLFPTMEAMGAFSHATSLTKITIPKSVKKIGLYSFANTALEEVTIASDCTYSETSFPKDCVIKFYTEDE